MKNINKLLQKAYKRYCSGDEHCYVMTCPINTVIWNMGTHLFQRNKLLIYGNYKLMERMGK